MIYDTGVIKGQLGRRELGVVAEPEFVTSNHCSLIVAMDTQVDGRPWSDAPSLLSLKRLIEFSPVVNAIPPRPIANDLL